ncbi:MAG: DEAD/DEAH box helicase [Phycisphaerales bacterium]
MQTFSTLGPPTLASHLLRAVEEEGYTKPTPIQAQCIPPGILGRDVLGCAQTGTGKTAAFALPILHRLGEMPIDKSRRGPAIPRALILSPTRELASQIGESFATYGRHTGLTHTVIFGGVNQFHQVRALHRGVDILVATPGRLIDLMEQRLVILTAVSILVLDEADRMLDMGFIQPIRRIVAALPGPPAPRQTLLFSATMPKEITHLAEALLKNPVRVSVTPVASAAPLITQRMYSVPRARKVSLLQHLLREAGVKRAVVFTRTKHGADKLCRKLSHAGVAALAIHGNKNQNQRTRALESFRAGEIKVLVATDVAARGLDIDDVTHVFNFELPVEPEAYVHRIGRTGRAGATGLAVSFCDEDERSQLRDIERLTGKRFEMVRPPADLEEMDPGELHVTTARHVSRYAYPNQPPRHPRKPEHVHRAAPAPGGNAPGSARAKPAAVDARARAERENRREGEGPARGPSRPSGAGSGGRSHSQPGQGHPARSKGPRPGSGVGSGGAPRGVEERSGSGPRRSRRRGGKRY